MSPKKLTNDDKIEILKLYRETPETTSTLADRFGVSSSTISRYLKNSLSDLEYEELIQQKRLARTTKSGKDEDEEIASTPKQTSLELYLTVTGEASAPESSFVSLVPKEEASAPEQSFVSLVPKEEASAPEQSFVSLVPKEETSAIELISNPALEKATEDDKPRPVLRKKSEIETETLREISEKGETVREIEEDDDLSITSVGEMFGEDMGDLEEDEDLEEDWEDEEDLEEDYAKSFPKSDKDLQILPISAADFPATCYLVIDRTSELITCPLREFTHLGTIPEEEVYQRTLPIFDNHRVARRFSKRSQRVIKVPDGKILEKTYPYLADKGITRLLLDGRIYALP